MIRKLFHGISCVVIAVLKPLKTYAYRTRFFFVRGLILEITTLIDWLMIFFNIQNNIMLLHQKIYGGNFLFGQAVMITDYDTTARDITKPLFKCNHFMGVDIIANQSSVFGMNAGSLNQCPPLRASSRAMMDATVFTEELAAQGYEQVKAECAGILEEWAADPKMAGMWSIRGTATRIFLKVLSGTLVSKEDADYSTKKYVTHFGELSIFGRYLPSVNGLLGSHKFIRKEAYFRLKEKYDIDMGIIDMTLFAAMFSVGTLLIRCVEDIQTWKIPYGELDYEKKRNFIFEVQRLWPTVTSVHRIVERDETVRIGNRELKLTPGDEVVYPFICSNRDESTFDEPKTMKLDRPAEEYERVLSWSKGPHACPGKEISIDVTLVMLDELARHHDLSRLKIFNPTF